LLRPAGGAAIQRPNIVFLQSDSWDGRVLGYLGHPAMRRATPNLDRLASRGTAFRNAYTSHPVCCPSRANMWSGRYTQHVESWNNHKGLSETDRTFKNYLEAAGYRFASKEGGIGKHDYLSGGHTMFNRVVEWTAPAGIRLPQFRMARPRVMPDESESHRSDWSRAEGARSFLQQEAKAGAPFFLYVGLSMPHPPFVTKRKWLNLIDRDAVTIPPEDQEVHPVMDYQRISKDWRHGFTPDAVRETRAIYYAMCAETDAIIGSIVNEVERLGLADNTYIVVTSDHGENNMEHRQYYKMNMYESSARVPLVISGPGVRGGRMLDNVVSLIDLFPTLLEMGGLRPPAGIDGESLMPLLSGARSRSRDWAYAMYSGSTANSSMFMLRQGDWKYIAYPGYGPQLFNLREDPEEVRNLAARQPDVVRAMDRQLRSVTDYEEVHRRVLAYDRASFRAWRERARREGVVAREFSREGKAATYEEFMAHCYRGWAPEHAAQLERWLS
jgi:arylsulfatase K